MVWWIWMLMTMFVVFAVHSIACVLCLSKDIRRRVVAAESTSIAPQEEMAVQPKGEENAVEGSNTSIARKSDHTFFSTYFQLDDTLPPNSSALGSPLEIVSHHTRIPSDLLRYAGSSGAHAKYA